MRGAIAEDWATMIRNPIATSKIMTGRRIRFFVEPMKDHNALKSFRDRIESLSSLKWVFAVFIHGF